MKLTHVTITGADDAVDRDDLVSLSKHYPFVEWGILASNSRRGTPRYPSTKWMNGFGEAIYARYELHPRRPAAVHLCGELSRLAIAGRQPFDVSWGWLIHFWSRVQLNGFSAYRLPMLALASEDPETQYILQVQNKEALLHASELYELDKNIAALWDLSGGEGKAITWFPPTGLLPMGFAGGIGPDNVVELARYITTSLGEPDEPTWIDMESGVRTDDRFDLDKVRRVLAAVAPWVQEAGTL